MMMQVDGPSDVLLLEESIHEWRCDSMAKSGRSTSLRLATANAVARLLAVIDLSTWIGGRSRVQSGIRSQSRISQEFIPAQ
jgi:hypothetical protein